MLVIYDLDKTSVYCPLAEKLDRYIPKNMILKKLYYNLYPVVHWLELKLGLLKINKYIKQRAETAQRFGARQIVLTARHYTRMVVKHCELVFGDIPITLTCISQGLTKISKARYVQMFENQPDEEIVMFDDNKFELKQMKRTFGSRFHGIQLEFLGDVERILNEY